MNLCVRVFSNRGATLFSKLVPMAAIVLMVCGLASATLAAPAIADRNQCAPTGMDSATPLPKDLTENPAAAQDDPNTTPTVEPLSSVNTGALGLGTPGV